MRKNWIGTVVLVGTSLIAGALFSQMWEQSLGQPGGFIAEPQVPPQVVVNQPAELPKWFVETVALPPLADNLPQRAIIIVDTESKKIAVYRLETATGKLWWLSTRDIAGDLKVNQFNATSPLPAEMMKEMQRIEGQR
jgi:hypothetical protein